MLKDISEISLAVLWLTDKRVYTAYAATVHTLQLLWRGQKVSWFLSQETGKLSVAGPPVARVCSRRHIVIFVPKQSTICYFTCRACSWYATPGRILKVFGCLRVCSSQEWGHVTVRKILQHLESSHILEDGWLKKMLSCPSRILGLNFRVCWENAVLGSQK